MQLKELLHLGENGMSKQMEYGSRQTNEYNVEF
jgi:hypothetical protein